MIVSSAFDRLRCASYAWVRSEHSSIVRDASELRTLRLLLSAAGPFALFRPMPQTLSSSNGIQELTEYRLVRHLSAVFLGTTVPGCFEPSLPYAELGG